MNRPSAGGRVLLVLVFSLLIVPAVSGCAGGTGAGSPGPGWTTRPSHDAMAGMSQAMQAAWAGRPTYVATSARTEEAYAFAMARPDVVRWMPCYCGCAAMDHRSNLDCFFKPTNEGRERLTFEEHASYCQVCVDEALMAKSMSAQGQSLRAIREAIDQAFGGNAPGTETALPPA